METSEILKEHLNGKYVLKIQTGDCRTVNEIEFKNLYEAIDYARQLTFSDCERMMGESEENIVLYNAFIFMKEDCFGYDCLLLIEEDTYPSLYYFSIWKP